jgi:tetratricopeptide (TPR) repeat protein
VLHARIVEAIEALYADRLDEHVERLAHHASRGQVWEKAVSFCLDAGKRAMGRSAVRESIGYFEQALAALEQLPETPERLGQKIDVRFELRTAHWSLNDHVGSHVHVQAAEELAARLGDPRRQGWVAAYQAHHLRATVDHRRGVETGEQAIRIAVELGDRRLRIVATEAVAQSYHEMGQFPRALQLLHQNILATEAEGMPGDLLGSHRLPMVVSLNVQGWCQSWLGNFAEAIESAAEGVRIAEENGHPLTLSTACFASGLVYTLKGEASRGIALLERARFILQSLERAPHPAVDAFHGNALTVGGRHDEAVALLEQSLKGAAIVKFMPCTSLWTGWLASAYRQAGRPDDARHAAERAILLARSHHERGFEGCGLRELGDVVAVGASPDVQQAEDLYRQALAIAEDLEMRPLQAHTHLSLGKLYRRAGRHHDARAELNVAIDLYLTMEMRHWVPEAEAELVALET